jgi:hypothetical protein
MLSISSRDSGVCDGWRSAARPAILAILILISSLDALRASGSETVGDAAGDECQALCSDPAAIIAETINPRYTTRTPEPDAIMRPQTLESLEVG